MLKAVSCVAGVDLILKSVFPVLLVLTFNVEVCVSCFAGVDF